MTWTSEKTRPIVCLTWEGDRIRSCGPSAESYTEHIALGSPVQPHFYGVFLKVWFRFACTRLAGWPAASSADPVPLAAEPGDRAAHPAYIPTDNRIQAYGKIF